MARPEALIGTLLLGLHWASPASAESAAPTASPARQTPSPAPDSPPAPDPFGPRHSASLSFFSFFGPGLTVEHETYVRPPVLSFVSALGFRTTGGADFTTLTLGPSLEARLWLGNVGPWRSADRRMTGPLLALREDLAWTTVEDHRRARLAGTAVEIAETLSLGYRVRLWRFHATPLLGGTLTTQLDPSGRLAPLTFLSGKLAITFGLLF